MCKKTIGLITQSLPTTFLKNSFNMNKPTPNKKNDWLEAAEEVLIRYCGEFSPFLIDKAKGSYIYTKNGRNDRWMIMTKYRTHLPRGEIQDRRLHARVF